MAPAAEAEAKAAAETGPAAGPPTRVEPALPPVSNDAAIAAQAVPSGAGLNSSGSPAVPVPEISSPPVAGEAGAEAKEDVRPSAPGPAEILQRPSPDPEADLELEAEVDAIEVHLKRAPAWRRVLASAIDTALAGLFVALLLGPIVSRSDLPRGFGLDEVLEALARPGGVLLLAVSVAAVVTFAYQWLGIALMGATPGKHLFGLRVVGPDGRRPSFGRSALRAAFSIPSFLLLGLGPLLGLFTRSGRSLHDFGAGTYPVLAP